MNEEYEPLDIAGVVMDYVNASHYNGALFINGEWGVGKSYYWWQRIVPAINNLKNEKTGSLYKVRYVSLNGLTEPEQIMVQLLKLKFRSDQKGWLIRWIWNPLVNLLSRLFTANKYIQTGIETTWDEIPYFRDVVFCFDDLERNKIQDRVLGFISTNFIERRECKVVIIGNEKEITMSEMYHQTKEKVMFRSLKFDPRLVKLTDIFSRYERNCSFHKLLNKYTELIRSISDTQQQHNLRTLIFALDCLENIYNADPFLSKNHDHEVVRSVLLFVFLICFEFKDGNLNTADCNDFKDLDKLSEGQYLTHSHAFFSKQVRTRDQEKKAELQENMDRRYEFRFYNKFKIVEHGEYLFYPSIYRYILSGELKTADLIAEVKGYEVFASKRDINDTPQLRALKAIRQLSYITGSDEEIKKIVDEFVTFTENGDYVFYEYGTFVPILQNWIDAELLSLDMASVKKRIKDGYQKSSIKPFGDISFLRLDTDPMNLVGNDPDLRPLIETRMKEAIAFDGNKEVQRLKDAIRTSSQDFYNSYAFKGTFDALTVVELFDISQESYQASDNIRRMLDFAERHWSSSQFAEIEEKLETFLKKIEEKQATLPNSFARFGNKKLIPHVKRLIEKGKAHEQ